MQTGIYITRKWGEAEIIVRIYKRGQSEDGTFISLYTDLDTFKKMLKEEMKTQGPDEAIDTVLRDIKEVTNKVMK